MQTEEEMKNDKIKKILNVVSELQQFKDDSKLYGIISDVIHTDKKRAKELASTYCNMVSTYAILRASDNYKNEFNVFLDMMIKRGYAEANGWINLTKSELFQALKITGYINKSFKDFEDVLNPLRLNPDKFYQVKIKADTHGVHFFAAYISDGVVYGVDSSYRGCPFIIADKIKPEKFEWISEVI